MKTAFATTTRVACALVAACGLIVASGVPRAASAQTPWATYPFADESGSISLPDGWAIETAYRGEVSASGSQEGIPRVDLGVARVFWQPGTTGNPNLAVPYGDPAQAMAQALPRLLMAPDRVRVHGLHGRWTVSWWQHGPAAYLDFDWSYAGRPLRSRALVLMAPTGGADGSWYYYHSVVTADAAQFRNEWPVLHRIWSSYYSRVLPERVWDFDDPGTEG